MIEKTLILPVSTPVQVTVSADAKGLLNIGIRINGGNDCLLAKGVTIPTTSNAQTCTKIIGELM